MQKGQEMKRIAIVSSRFLPSYGGVEQYTYQLGSELARRGYEVHVFATLEPGSASHENMSGFTVHRYKAMRIQNGRLPWTTEKKRLIQDLEIFEPDFILIQSRLYNMSAIAAEYARKDHVAAAIVEHGTSWVKINNPLVQQGSVLYEKYLLSRVRKTDIPFYTVSEAGLNWLRSISIIGKGVLYNAISPADVTSLIPSDVPKKKNQILFCGRLVHGKGLLETIQAVQQLNKDGADLKLAIAGDGPLKNQIPQDGNIEYRGRLDHAHLYPLMAESALFCMPSESEGFPTVILEAIMAGTLVAASSVGGIPEIIKDGQTGFMIDSISVDGVKSAIFRALGSDKPDEIMENAKCLVLDNFTWEKTCDQLEKVMDSCII